MEKKSLNYSKSVLQFAIPAKINLFLRLTGKRHDGYNNLITVYQKIGLFDAMSLRRIPRGFKLRVEGDNPCLLRDNLVTKAYMLLKKTNPFKGGVSIYLRKHIPAGSGLGGASADAAYALHGINRLYKLQIQHEKLIDMGSRLGADVPFFLQPFATGLGIERGDVITELPAPARCWLLLIIFEKPLATKKVYENFHYPDRFCFNLTKLSRDVIMLSRFLQCRGELSLRGLLQNDLLSSAQALMPEIKSVLSRLKQCGFHNSAMTGSGPTVYSLFRCKRDAELAKSKLLTYRGIRMIVCPTVTNNFVN